MPPRGNVAYQASRASLYLWEIARGSSTRNAGTALSFAVVIVAGMAAGGDSIRVALRVVVCVVVMAIISDIVEDPDGDDGDNERVIERVDVCVVVCVVVEVCAEACNRCS